MFLLDAVKAYNKNSKDPIARAHLLAIVGNKAVFKPNAKPDAADVERAFDFLTDLDADRAAGGKYKNYQTLAEYEGAGKKALGADPSVDGVALDPYGISQDAAEIDWSAVSQERRLLVLHGRDIGKITQSPDPDTRQRWANELADNTATLTGQWQKIAESLDKLKISAREALEERLVYRRKESQFPVAAIAPNAAPVPPPGAVASVCVSGSTIIIGSGNVVRQTGTHVVKAFILFDGADARFVQPLKSASCGGMVRSGMLTLSSIADCPPGAGLSNWIASRVNDADMVLWLNSADFLGNPELMSWLNFIRGTTKHMVPISVRQTYEIPFNLRPLPLDKPVARYTDADEAWVTVSYGLRQVVESIRKAKGG